jgi:hypothetical protein
MQMGRPGRREHVTSLEGRGPAGVRVRAAVLAAVAAPGGCPAGALHARVASLLGRGEEASGRDVESALGLLLVTGAVDEVGGRLVLTLGARVAV